MKIAFLDSGIGGLSVVEKVFEKKGGEFLYYSDNKYMPYGALTAKVLSDHIASVCEKLVSAGAETIVLACNTATATCIDRLRAEFPKVSFVGTEPAVRPALCFDGDVLVLATPLTLAQPRFKRLLVANDGRRFLTPDCSGLAFLVERDFPDISAAQKLLDRIIAPYVGEKTGAVVLGCTHYSYLEVYIRRRYGLSVVSGAGGVVRQLFKVAPADSFCQPPLLKVACGDEEGLGLLVSRARSICKVDVEPY